MDVIIPTNLVHVLFDPAIPTSSFNFIQLFLYLYYYRSYGVLLWEIVSYGKTPLGDSSVEDIISAAQNRTLYHARYVHVPN